MPFLGKHKLQHVPVEILKHAEKVCSGAGSSFTKSFALMTPTQRKAMTLFYAFCREVDDWADEEELGSLQSRQSVLRAIHDEVSGGPSTAKRSHWETVIGVGHLMEDYNIPAKPFLDLVDGMLMDCQNQYYRLWQDVLQYCYRVASTVGIVSVHVFSHRPVRALGERVLEYAIEQGLALQLVNIYRDFYEDLERGRCYIPMEWLGVSAVDMIAFLEASSKAKKQHLLYELLLSSRERVREQAHVHFASALDACPAVARWRVWPLLVLGMSYMNLLDDIPVRTFERPKANPWRGLRDALPHLLGMS